METSPLSKYTVSFGLSLALCSVINGVLVVVKEKNASVAASMQKMTGHHWITHSAFIVLLFFVCGWLFSLPGGGRGWQMASSKLIRIVAGGVILGGLIIVGFYLFAD